MKLNVKKPFEFNHLVSLFKDVQSFQIERNYNIPLLESLIVWEFPFLNKFS
jgi:hypothetical protein